MTDDRAGGDSFEGDEGKHIRGEMKSECHRGEHIRGERNQGCA